MTTAVSASTIAAQAFREMELSPISSFADDTPQAQAANDQYPIALNMCLEAADWGFASVTVSLPQNATGPQYTDPDLPYAFQVPSDCLVVREFGDRWSKWRLEKGGLIRSADAGPVRLRYTATVATETKMPATFQTAVAYQLAILLAPTWLGTVTKRQLMDQHFQKAMAAAMNFHAEEASQAPWYGDELPEDWVADARLGGQPWGGFW